jgi:putative DNA primase/helicase
MGKTGSVTGREFDRDPMLLGVLNSVIDLRADAKQRQRDGQPVDMITKQCPVKFEPDAKCPRWEQFLLEIFEGNQELIDFVQRAMGYSLTGESLEQVFFLLHGRGSNGKSTLLDTIQSLLGSSYSANLDFDALISEYRHRHQFDLANIEGRRFVVASETDRKVELSPKVVKSLVGNGKIVVNEKFKQPRAIEPQHKLWLAVNELPTATDRTDGFWRRILLIPFERQFLVGEKDLMLPKVLLGELPGILNWAVAGCLEWQRAGLDPPRAVTIATTEYHERSDCFYRFITECCIVGTDPNAETTSQALREAYDTWRELNPDAPEDLQGKGLLASIVAQGAVQDRVHTPDGKRVRGVRRVRLLSPRGTVLG